MGDNSYKPGGIVKVSPTTNSWRKLYLSLTQSVDLHERYGASAPFADDALELHLACGGDKRPGVFWEVIGEAKQRTLDFAHEFVQKRAPFT